MLKNYIESRDLPNVLLKKDNLKINSLDSWNKHRINIKNLLCENEYGVFPKSPIKITANVLEVDNGFCASKAVYQKIILSVEIENGTFSFPVYFVFPKIEGKCKTIIHINFRNNIPDKYMPTEEIIDNGFAIVSFSYNDITSDDDDFTNGLAGLIFQGEPRKDNSPGKIVLWAWAAMRVMDFLQIQDNVDIQNVAVAGHSRLGKTALVTAAFDERFSFAYSNDSGCSGAAISRGKEGEKIQDITKKFPFWFCNNYKKYAFNDSGLPFDQHFLLSLIAPRNLYVASAVEDLWADPDSEFLSCVAASPVYELFGLRGLICDNAFPVPNQSFHNGNIGYHMRKGTHYFSRYDWNEFMIYMNLHSK